MAQAVLMRTRKDGRVWLVNFGEGAVTEVRPGDVEGLKIDAIDVDAVEAAHMRASPATFPLIIVD
jgi:hypothetical protein